uniref:Uncharacterized protein n=1 Tax=Castor canadensis TaxID=51338 RepID=A0A8C0ZR87_CASCN
MGNLLTKHHRRLRHVPWPSLLPRVSVTRAVCQPRRGHPAAPTPAIRPVCRLFKQNSCRLPVPAGRYSAPKRRQPLPQAIDSVLGILPSVAWGKSPKKPILSTRNSKMFGPSRTVRIPPPQPRAILRLSSSQQVVPAVEPMISKVKAQEEGTAKEEEEDQEKTEGPDNTERGSGEVAPLRSLKTKEDLISMPHSPGAQKENLHPKDIENIVHEMAPVSPMSSSSDGHGGPLSHSSAGDALTLGQPDAEAAVVRKEISPKRWPFGCWSQDRLCSHLIPAVWSRTFYPYSLPVSCTI